MHMRDIFYFVGVFGRCVAFMYVVEYQKRGLPHAHILLMVSESDRIITPGDVDCTISAEIPKLPSNDLPTSVQQQIRKLRDTVLKCMIHGPCGILNPRSPCMVNGKCSKGFPKQLRSETKWEPKSSYPFYRRRDRSEGGAIGTVGGFEVDNRWVVPYSPYLSLKYDAHINVEACISPYAAKYLFLYINKVTK